MKKLLCLFLLFFSIKESIFATTQEHGISKAIKEENETKFVELFRIKVVNEKGGEISISEDSGKTWINGGKVIEPATKINPKGYTASAWAKIGCVAATAVNSIHIKVDHNDKDDKGVIFSLVPKELHSPPKGYKSYFSPTSSIYTDVPAGNFIFGGGYSPFIGNKVFLEKENKITEIPKGFVPNIGDKIIILVERPEPYPSQIVFENRFGGLIKIIYPDGKEKPIGEVLKPVCGTGNFAGSLFTYSGRIRANHCGVVCISTSPIKLLGGFQIIPANHGMTSEMEKARLITQWMVIGPLSVLEPDLAGTAPLFSNFIRPDYSPDDINKENWKQRLLERFLVQVKVNNGEWELMPRLVGRKDDALKNITHIRILFPIFEKRR